MVELAHCGTHPIGNLERETSRERHTKSFKKKRMTIYKLKNDYKPKEWLGTVYKPKRCCWFLCTLCCHFCHSKSCPSFFLAWRNSIFFQSFMWITCQCFSSKVHFLNSWFFLLWFWCCKALKKIQNKAPKLLGYSFGKYSFSIFEYIFTLNDVWAFSAFFVSFSWTAI